MNKDDKKIIIYTDGGARGNPGPAGIGVVILDSIGNVIKTSSAFVGLRTNNEAEYEAVILALQKAKLLFGRERAGSLEVEMRLDSQLVARHLRGEYKINEPNLVPLFIKVHNLTLDFGKVSFVEIEREKNVKADSLANEAMDAKDNKGSTLFS